MGKKKQKPTAEKARQLREYLEQANLTQTEAARQLGLTDRMVRYYCAGDVRIPQVVWLALKTITGRKQPEAAR